MKKLSLILVALVISACASQPTPRDRYIQALNHKLNGNAAAYFDELIALAHDAPESRAGRRARNTIQNAGFPIELSVIGIAAAVAVPNFLKFRSRAKQSEAKTTLRLLATAQRAHFAEHSRYCKQFTECGFQPPENARYLYMLSSQEMVGGEGADDMALLRMMAPDVLREMGVEPNVTNTSFKAVAVSNIDDDIDLDIWVIDEKGQPQNIVNDLN